MFKLLNRLFGSRKPVRPAPVPPPPAAHGSASRSSAQQTSAPEDPSAVAVRQATNRPKIDPTARPEDLCGLTPGMTTEEIRDHLAMLYRRHNRAASSLEGDLREEAEIMLDAVVRCRETFLGVPAAATPSADS
jgi:hypothetical protein